MCHSGISKCKHQEIGGLEAGSKDSTQARDEMCAERGAGR